MDVMMGVHVSDGQAGTPDPLDLRGDLLSQSHLLFARHEQDIRPRPEPPLTITEAVALFDVGRQRNAIVQDNMQTHVIQQPVVACQRTSFLESFSVGHDGRARNQFVSEAIQNCPVDLAASAEVVAIDYQIAYPVITHYALTSTLSWSKSSSWVSVASSSDASPFSICTLHSQ
jgi:hypothetical protein